MYAVKECQINKKRGVFLGGGARVEVLYIAIIKRATVTKATEP